MLLPVMERKGFSVAEHQGLARRLREMEICLQDIYLWLERAYGRNNPATARAGRLTWDGPQSQLWQLRSALDTLAKMDMAPAERRSLYFVPDSPPRTPTSEVAVA